MRPDIMAAVAIADTGFRALAHGEPRDELRRLELIACFLNGFMHGLTSVGQPVPAPIEIRHLRCMEMIKKTLDTINLHK